MSMRPDDDQYEDLGDRRVWRDSNRRIHRAGAPAIIFNDKNSQGLHQWMHHGFIHREDGPAIIWKDGSTYWYLNGKLHRTTGPAIEYCGGTKQWWVNGQRHRTDGPAIESSNDYKEWWVEDVYIGSSLDKQGCYTSLMIESILKQMASCVELALKGA